MGLDRIVLATCVAGAFLTWSSQAVAWGPVGHETVAYIAASNVKANTLQQGDTPPTGNRLHKNCPVGAQQPLGPTRDAWDSGDA
jgi:hypothetical protein